MFRLTDKWNTGLVVPGGIVRKNRAGIFRLVKRTRRGLVALEGECGCDRSYRHRPIVSEQIRFLIAISFSLMHLRSPFYTSQRPSPAMRQAAAPFLPLPTINLPQSRIAISLDFNGFQAV
ncbi:hypothetical protein RHECNPAF_730093 [Rhizobium etli CNPAF512]|nr:hypothetical protein RHECNPAF_730093 [Rhizobium etli CNPAF512]